MTFRLRGTLVCLAAILGACSSQSYTYVDGGSTVSDGGAEDGGTTGDAGTMGDAGTHPCGDGGPCTSTLASGMNIRGLTLATVSTSGSDAGTTVGDGGASTGTASPTLFWSMAGTSAENYVNGSIASLSLSGGTVATLATELDNPQAIVAGSSDIYWFGLNGGVSEAAYKNGATFTFASTGNPLAIASNSTTLFSLDKTLGILQLPFGGGAPSTLCSATPITAGDNAYSLAADVANVYWWDAKLGLAMESVSGGTPKSLVPMASVSSQDFANGYPGIASDGRNVYFTLPGTESASHADGVVVEVSIAGGTPTTLASMQTDPSQVVVDDVGIYWITADGNLNAVGLSGGQPGVVATGTDPIAVVVDATSLYWADLGTATGDDSSGSIMKVTPKLPGVQAMGTDGGVDDGGVTDAGVEDGGLTDGGVVDGGTYVIWDGGPINTTPTPGTFCALSGSYLNAGDGGLTLVGTSPVDLSWLTIPPGFCAHHFGTVGNARKIKLAPGGELFVASPTEGTTSGGVGGQNSIVVLADDNGDGYADTTTTFLGGGTDAGTQLIETDGIAFANGYFYYQDYTCIRRLPYTTGERVSTGDPTFTGTDPCAEPDGGEGGPPMRSPTVWGAGIINITTYESATHWPKAMDVADDGTIYVTNGGDQGEECVEPMPYRGGVWQVNGTPGGMPIIKGLRNAIDLKCQAGHDHCFGLELALDYSAAQGGREKLFLVQSDDNYGYPCCATTDTPYSGVLAYSDAGVLLGTPDCSDITPEDGAFVIGETPFGVDFEPGKWPGQWAGSAIVALHGAFGSWVGARVVAIATDVNTGMPIPASDLTDGSSVNDFATGWDDGHRDHGRPTAVALSPDGRLYISNDQNGEILWIAPIQ